MSLDRSTESLNSPSKDSFGSFTSYSWSRSNTVRKVNSIGSSTPCTVKEQGAVKRLSVDDLEVTTDRILDNLNVEHGGRDKLRKCLTDIAYRQSLDSISEYKAKTSFSSQRPPSRECSSFESSASSDCTECALQTGTGDSNLKGTTLSENSSCYLSWIESLNSEYLSNASITDVASVDGKAGEWNNFWLNYNNARNRYSQQNSFSCSMSTSDNTADDFIDSKIADNIQKEQFSENPSDLFYMTRSEILETIKCCQKIIEVLQSALSKTADNTRNNSNYIMSKRTVSVYFVINVFSITCLVYFLFRVLLQKLAWILIDIP